MARGHARPIDGESSQNQGIDGSVETLLRRRVGNDRFADVESERSFLGPKSHSRSDARRENRRSVRRGSRLRDGGGILKTHRGCL